MAEPVAPDPAQYKDEETYAIRKANYDKVRAVFDDNLKDGTITPVYEICFSGLLSGETKYVYYVPDTEEEPFAGNKLADNNRRISELKVKLHEANEHRKEEFVERQRSFMESAEYSTLNTDLSGRITHLPGTHSQTSPSSVQGIHRMWRSPSQRLPRSRKICRKELQCNRP